MLNGLEKLFAYVHLQDLIRFRKNTAILDAAADWLDKEIADLKSDLGIREDGCRVIFTTTDQAASADAI